VDEGHFEALIVGLQSVDDDSMPSPKGGSCLINSDVLHDTVLPLHDFLVELGRAVCTNPYCARVVVTVSGEGESTSEYGYDELEGVASCDTLPEPAGVLYVDCIFIKGDTVFVAVGVERVVVSSRRYTLRNERRCGFGLCFHAG